MGSGGEQFPQKRHTRDGMDPILIRPNTSDDVGRTSRTDGFLGDDGEPPRQNTSAIRLDVPGSRNRTTGSHQPSSMVPQRRPPPGATRNPTRQQPRPTPVTREQRPDRSPARNHWLLPVGIAMVILVIVWVLGSAVLAWGTQRYNDLRYGTPRTYQTDAVVGHSDSAKNPSHFIAMNLNRQAIVIEFMGGDPAKAVTYLAPVFIAGNDGELAPVTLEFRDVTGDGKLDMLVHIHLSGQDQISVFVNAGNKFRPSTGTDRIRL
ncbi:MAG TPA: hypothetical protein VGT82_11220 [Ktedonobacteraceae bacterium]|nr:hypothetical protein [Ktedonobacteraceae bacterium]